MKMMQSVQVGDAVCGPGRPLLWILGPCVIESQELTLRIAETLAELAARLRIPVVFKASFDKANRTSGKSFRGPGLGEGLKTLAAVKERTGLAAVDRHTRRRSKWVRSRKSAICCKSRPSWRGRRTSLLAAGRSGRVVNVKKGQFMAPWDMRHVVAQDGRSRQSPAAVDRARRYVRL